MSMAQHVSKLLFLLLVMAMRGSLLAQAPLPRGEGTAPSGLNARQFKKYWCVESEATDYQVVFRGDTCELVAPKGLTLWRRELLQADCAVEYDVQVVVERDGDRLSDMNCFWLASDPEAKDLWQRIDWRSGIFARCYSLQMYYLGYGGNYNTTTRFRRYTAAPAEEPVALAAGKEYARPPVIVEYTDSAHLLRPNHWYHVKLQTAGGRTQMWVDGELIVSYLDPEPLDRGWFGFRTTLSRTRITGFRCYCVKPLSADTAIPLRWIGAADSVSVNTVPVTFGVPFAQGELKDVSRLALSDQRPADAWVNARWPDGSVKWAAMATTLPVGKEVSIVLTSGKARRQRTSSSPFVTETDRQFIVGDGIVTYIPKHGQCIIDSIVMTAGRVAGSAQLVATTADATFVSHIDSVCLERSGNELSVVRINGKHQSASRSWLPFTVRLYLYRQHRQIKLVHTFIYDGNEQHDRITALGIRFGVPMRQESYNRHIAFATNPIQHAQGEGGAYGVWAEAVQPLDGRRPLTNRRAAQLQQEGRRIAAYGDMNEYDRELVDHWAAWDGYRLSQLTDNSFSIRKRAITPEPGQTERTTPWIGTYTGQRATGYAFVGDTKGGLGVYMQDFWQSYPSTIQVDHARSAEAQLTMYLWSPEAEPMNLCHYDTIAHDLLASYEDVQKGLSTPYGIGRTTTFWLDPQPGYPGKQLFARQAAQLADDPRLMPTPEYMHQKRAFGVWSLPSASTANGSSKVEQRLTEYLEFYRNAIEQHKWYGFWNYGDMMHAYDPVRHSWRYDVGGYAWDNTELATPMWLWYSFLRTGRQDVWRMAEAMTRHNSEVDTYHLGPLAPLGSRHNVSHWGCGAKEARISQAAFLRFYYYLTGGDERIGELMHAQTDADTLLLRLDPMRLAEPREKYPCTAPARLRLGPDWLAYAGNWMTEWERTGNTYYRDKIRTGMESIGNLSDGFFTGNKALGYDPANGRISYEGPADRRNTNHLATIMGGFEVMNELLPLVPLDSFKAVWLSHALRYKQMARDVSHNNFPVRRLQAYAAWQTRSPKLASEAWNDLWGRIEHTEAPQQRINRVNPPLVPTPVDEWSGLSTNDAALWCLDAIYMLEVLANP